MTMHRTLLYGKSDMTVEVHHQQGEPARLVDTTRDERLVRSEAGYYFPLDDTWRDTERQSLLDAAERLDVAGRRMFAKASELRERAETL